MSYTQEDIQRQWDDMPKEDYPWSDEDMPFMDDDRDLVHQNDIEHHVVGCACFLCLPEQADQPEIKDEDCPF